jgi:hypothetical protein
MPRYFTIEEANALLDKLRPLVAQLQELKRQTETAQKELEDLTPPAGSNGHSRDPHAIRVKSREVDQLTRRSERVLRAVHQLDCEVKDVEKGLVDFLSMREGREVYLCWRVSEPEVAWWHDLETGFTGRQPL